LCKVGFCNLFSSIVAAVAGGAVSAFAELTCGSHTSLMRAAKELGCNGAIVISPVGALAAALRVAISCEALESARRMPLCALRFRAKP